MNEIVTNNGTFTVKIKHAEGKDYQVEFYIPMYKRYTNIVKRVLDSNRVNYKISNVRYVIQTCNGPDVIEHMFTITETMNLIDLLDLIDMLLDEKIVVGMFFVKNLKTGLGCKLNDLLEMKECIDTLKE